MRKGRRQFLKRVIGRAACALLLLALAVPRTAAADADGAGSILVHMKDIYHPEDLISGVKIGLYEVASGSPYGHTEMAPAFRDSGVDEDELLHPDAGTAETLSEYAVSSGVPAVDLKVTGEDGSAEFGDLEDGIYLLRQLNGRDDFEGLGYTASFGAFLVFIPMASDDGGYVRSIECSTKGERITDTPEEVRVAVEKHWEDANDIEGVRPPSIEVGLYDGKKLKETVKLDASCNWRHEWSGLDPDAAWSVDELEIPKEYVKEVVREESDLLVTYTITNVYFPGGNETPVPSPPPEETPTPEETPSPERTPTPEKTPTPGGGNGTPPSGGGSSGGRTSPPKTGDESNGLLYLIVMGAAAAAVLLLARGRKRGGTR